MLGLTPISVCKVDVPKTRKQVFGDPNCFVVYMVGVRKTTKQRYLFFERYKKRRESEKRKKKEHEPEPTDAPTPWAIDLSIPGLTAARAANAARASVSDSPGETGKSPNRGRGCSWPVPALRMIFADGSVLLAEFLAASFEHHDRYAERPLGSDCPDTQSTIRHDGGCRACREGGHK